MKSERRLEMGKKKVDDDPTYVKACNLNGELKKLNEEIRIIDEAISEMQMSKAAYEVRGGKATPFFFKTFKITKKKETNEYFAEPSNNYYENRAIRLCEAEFIMLRGFKESRVAEINKQIQELSAKINED